MTKAEPQNLASSVSTLKGVGPQTVEKLAKLHVTTVQDVLFHLPSRYEDRTHVTSIGSLQPQLSAVVIGRIELVQVVFRRRRSLLVQISDGTSNLVLRFFYFSRSQEKAFKRGVWIRCFGEIRHGANGQYEMVHPEYRVSEDKPVGALSDTLTPVYPSTEGVSQLFWRKISEQALTLFLPRVSELVPTSCLPENLQHSFESISIQTALQQIHRPPANVNLQAMSEAKSPAHQRLIFEELLGHHFSLRKARLKRQNEQAPVLNADETATNTFLERLPFSLTGAQQRVHQEVRDDLMSTMPMMRLVQGDVGSGKTVVAALAMLQAVSSQQQTLLMAPTELLAEQHYNTLKQWFEPLGITVGWLASKTPMKLKNETIAQLASGELLAVVGTHALFQEAVHYKKLGLVVIDEQHRFGVDQRLSLRSKTSANVAPHQLLMTATPIPRTLAMSFYADLDVSSIDELPPGRQPVETVVLASELKRHEVIQRVHVACQQGRQVYWVCPLIDQSEEISAQAATEVEEELSSALTNLKVGLVHGRMKAKDKEATMQQFRDGQINLLVATTVIEVGVDVPNASLMVIENSERMGLAQLHQLRGRVGRGSEKSYCMLLYQHPLSQHAKQRLQIMRETNDGFVIAEKDLSIRGAGELLGTRQTGSLSFKIADLVRDQELLPTLESCATLLAEQAPDKIEPLIHRWVGSKQDYANA